MMHFVDEPGTRRIFVSTDARRALQRQLRRQDGDAVPRHQCAGVGRQRAVAGARARRPELRLPPAVQSARHARLRQVLHLHRHLQHDAEARLRHARHPSARTTRCCSSGRRRIRRPPPTTATRRASSFAPRSRSTITTAARSASTAWRRRAAPSSACSMSASATAAAAATRSTSRRTWPRRSARSCASIRSARTAPTGSYGIPASNPFVKDAKPDTLGEIYASGRAQPAAVHVGLRRPAACSSPISARTRSRRSARSRRAPISAGTSGRRAFRT